MTEAQKNAIIHAIKTIIEKMSEEYYCSEWMTDIEFLLWHDVNYPGWPGDEKEDLVALKELSIMIGGWVYFDKNPSVNGIVFVPLDRWEQMAAEREARCKENAND